MLCFFLQIVCPNCTTLGVTGYEIDSKTEGCSEQLVGCGPSVDIWTAAQTGNIEAVKQHLADGVDVNSKNDIGRTPLDVAIAFKQSPIADLLRQHSGKTRDELKAAESIVAAIRLNQL